MSQHRACCCQDGPPTGPCPPANSCCDCCETFRVSFDSFTVQFQTGGTAIYTCGSVLIPRQPAGGCACVWSEGFQASQCFPSNPGAPQVSATASIVCGSDFWRLFLSAGAIAGAIYQRPSSACPPLGVWQLQSANNGVNAPATVTLTCDTDPPPPPDPLGACCVGSECSERTQSACANAGGTWYGAGSTCAATECGTPPDPLGACCLPNGLCQNMTHATCNLHGGQWFGPPATCENHQCSFGESRGFGDSVSKFIRAVTFGKLKECKSCAERRALLNEIFPYSKGGQV